MDDIPVTKFVQQENGYWGSKSDKETLWATYSEDFEAWLPLKYDPNHLLDKYHLLLNYRYRKDTINFSIFYLTPIFSTQSKFTLGAKTPSILMLDFFFWFNLCVSNK